MTSEGKTMDIVLITGMSGAGKSTAANWFEDHGWYCVDNMPPLLIRNFLELAQFSMSGRQSVSRTAFVVDIRSEQFFKDLSGVLRHLNERDDVTVRILFLEATEAALIRRYNEIRRAHPLAQGRTISEAIEKERELIEPFRKQAYLVIDTTTLKVAQFQQLMNRSFGDGEEEQSQFSLSVSSFGFKYGLPQDADMIYDVRFIPNPYYVKSLRKLTGKNRKVAHYVLKQQIVKDFLAQVESMLEIMIPGYIKEGKYHLNLCFGCTGGQHRSVVMANAVAQHFREEGFRVFVHHREIE